VLQPKRFNTTVGVFLIFSFCKVQGCHTARKDLFDCSASFNMGRGSKSSVHARVLVLDLPPCKSSSHVIVDVKILAA